MRNGNVRFMVVIVAIACSLLQFFPMQVGADATPESASTRNCQVEPREFEQIAELAEGSAGPAHVISNDSDDATDDVIIGVTTTVSEAVACANANDTFRALALFTDRYIAERFGPGNPDDLGSLEATVSRTPVPAPSADHLQVVSIEQVRADGDDWASAVVTTMNRDQQFTDQIIFERVDGAWFIDSWTSLAETPATPVA